MSGSIRWVIALLVLAAALPARAGEAASVGNPSASKDGAGAEVSFAVSAPTDAEAAVLDTAGKVARSLAAGWPGGKQAPPEPSQTGLARKIEWDGMDNQGKLAAGGPFKSQVRLGVKPRLAGSIGSSPADYHRLRNGGAVRAMGVSEEAASKAGAGTPWRRDLEANAWVEITPKYLPPPGGGEHHPVSWNKLVYDSVGRRIINIDRWNAPGRVEGTYIYANSLMALDLGKDEIERLSLFNWKREASPSGGYRTVEMPENKAEPTPLPRHPYGDVAFVPEENAIYLSAGANQTTSSGGKAQHPNNTWRFDLAARKWEEIKGKQPPPSLSDCMTYVPDLNAIVRWVSEDEAAWFLDLKSRTWSKKDIPDSPRLGLRTAMTYDTKRKQVLLYGGQVLGSSFSAPGPQLWALSVTDLKWTRLPDGPPVSAPGWAYAPKHDVALCWRKINPKTWDTGECWVYFPGEQKWLRVESTAPTPPKLYQTLAYDESRDVFVCQTRPLKWYVMRLDPAGLKGVPQAYLDRRAKETPQTAPAEQGGGS